MSQIAAREREKNRTAIVGGPEASYRERDRAGMLETLEYFRELAHAFRSFPGLTLLGAAGLVTVAVAFDRSKAGMQGAEILFWLGLLILVIPFTIRLAMPGLDRSERIAAVLFLGMGLYLVKVMQNPLAFAYPDEYVHLFNVDQIRSTGHLFTPNPLIAVTSLYPGLAIVTSALADMTGLSSFHAGLVIIGAARLLLLLGLFFLFEEVSGSARVAGLGALAYAANPNFLFFNSQYAYESLALPLAVLLVSLVLTRLNTTDAAANLGLGVVTVLLVSTVVISHHVTAIALTGFLFALSAAYWFFYRGRVQKPILLALFALVAVLGWLLFVASATLGYLAPLFANAGASFGKLLAGLGVPRALFSSTSGYVPAFPERGIAIGGVLLTVAALPFGLLELWRKYRRSAAAWILAAAGVGYIFTLGLRLFPAAWEIGNRASEFLFIGVGFLLALAVAWLAGHAHASFARRVILGAAFAVIFAAGVIAGWPPLARLALPNFAEADQRTLNPEGIAAGTWARNYLLPGQIFAADPSNARPLVTLGNQVALTGSERGIRAMIYADRIDKSVIEILARAQVRYVLIDRRLKSWDQMVGLAFDRAGQNTALLPASAADKFDLPARVRRIYDSGDIVIYDVGDLTGVVPVQ